MNLISLLKTGRPGDYMHNAKNAIKSIEKHIVLSITLNTISNI